MKKKGLVLFFAILILSSFVSAINKIELSTIKESFQAGENITLKVSLYDEQNNLIDGGVSITLEDAEKRIKIEKTIPSNKLVDINLGENAVNGYWKITAGYKENEVTSLFQIETNELVKFAIQEDQLIVTNIGNTRYTKTIQVVIGETIGAKKLDLNIGESTTFKLIAPNGVYNIRVTDGKTTLTQSGVPLTGKVIGILDEKLVTSGNPLTSGIKPESSEEDFSYATLKNKNFVYIFLIVVIGAGVLLAIERKYRERL